jgi:hypothetical protein
MISGIVVAIRAEIDRYRLIVAHKPPSSSSWHESLGVDIAKGHGLPEVGDAIWWRSGTCYWTSRSTFSNDVPIPKLGYPYQVGLIEY